MAPPDDDLAAVDAGDPVTRAGDDPECAQGSQFTFDGVEYEATKVAFSESAAEQDTSHLGMPAGSPRRYSPPCLRDGAEVSIEFYGKTAPPLRKKAAIDFPGLPDVTGDAICTKIDLDASVGALVKGTATFRLSYAKAP